MRSSTNNGPGSPPGPFCLALRVDLIRREIRNVGEHIVAAGRKPCTDPPLLRRPQQPAHRRSRCDAERKNIFAPNRQCARCPLRRRFKQCAPWRGVLLTRLPRPREQKARLHQCAAVAMQSQYNFTKSQKTHEVAMLHHQ